jgi:parallel beta-helix repeat protein
MRDHVIPTDGMIITESTRFAPGVYALPNGLTIGADNVTLEGDQTLLVSAAHDGAGITLRGHSGVRIRNLAISGYYHGIRADDCRDLAIEGVTVRDTWEIPGIDTFLYLWLPIEKVYGGALLLHRVEQATVRECDLQHQLNGVLLYGCARVAIERVNASFNSGWGVYLSGSSDCTLADNQLDFCNRLFRRDDGSVRVEADAAGIVMVKGSSRNQILRNSCLCGGDGIFVAGYEHPGVHESCSDNLFEDNDCRLSPNNAIESTFSRGNIFRRNNCSRSNYGFWMGYSWDNVLEDNEVEFNRWVGIAAEHARGFVIQRNRIRLNGEGVRLWTRGGEVLREFPGWEVTHDIQLEDNLIESNRIGFNAYTGPEMTSHTQHHLTVRGNTLRDNRVGVQLDRVLDSTLSGNTLADNLIAAVRLVGGLELDVDNNTFSGNTTDTLRVPEGRLS